MSGHKFNRKRVRDTAIWSLLLTAIAAGLFFSVLRKSNAKVQDIQIDITGLNEGEQLINEKEIKQILQLAAGKSINKASIKSLDVRKLEAKLNNDKRIENADLYFDSNGKLHVKVQQKKPIMRVMEVSGSEYYIDGQGSRVPYLRGSLVRVPVVTGVRDTFFDKIKETGKPTKLKEVFEIMKYISDDKFLSSLVEQVDIGSEMSGDIVLIPKVGREKIVFGDGSNIKAKFDNLKIFYKDGMPKLGWSRYKTLNLAYANQVRGVLADPTSAPKILLVEQDSLTAELKSSNNHNIQ